MITKCRYCDYHKADEPISEHLIDAVFTSETEEDYMLWMERLMRQQFRKYGTASYNGVKVHIGRMHKGEYNSPTHEFNEQEARALSKYELQ